MFFPSHWWYRLHASKLEVRQIPRPVDVDLEVLVIVRFQPSDDDHLLARSGEARGYGRDQLLVRRVRKQPLAQFLARGWWSLLLGGEGHNKLIVEQVECVFVTNKELRDPYDCAREDGPRGTK